MCTLPTYYSQPMNDLLFEIIIIIIMQCEMRSHELQTRIFHASSFEEENLSLKKNSTNFSNPFPSKWKNYASQITLQQRWHKTCPPEWWSKDRPKNPGRRVKITSVEQTRHCVERHPRFCHRQNPRDKALSRFFLLSAILE